MKAVLRFAAAGMMAFTSACSVPQASYVSRDLDPGELAVVNAARMTILQGQANGTPPRRLDLDGLERAVACVPDAVGFVQTAKSIRSTGTVMKWIGWAAFIASTAVVVYSVVKSDDRFVRPMIAVGGSGALLTRMPGYLRPFSLIKSMDAVHAYEDQRLVLPACGGRPQSPPRTLPAPPTYVAPAQDVLREPGVPGPEPAQDDLPGPGAAPKEGATEPGGPR